MEFFRRPEARPSRLGILPGAFNPVTVAHLAVARAGLAHVDEVLFALPRVFPHKEYQGAPFADRIQMLAAALEEEPAFSIAAVEGGLFVEIARECREFYGNDVALTFLCGRDAAERIAGWDYGRPGALAEMLNQFDLLVATRGGDYRPPDEFRAAFRHLELARAFDHVSASEVRRRIAGGAPWEHLVPAAVRDRVREIYRAPQSEVIAPPRG